jgi:predicted alpha/beta-fold hydrolase
MILYQPFPLFGRDTTIHIMSHSFKPFFPLRNGHIQTTLTSLKLRKYIAKKRASRLRDVEQPVVLSCDNGVRLLGTYSENPSSTGGIVILIHGWEGSQDSSYILSAASSLYKAGYSIFRLNLRDHGNSHHLNPEPFNSSRLDEVALAVRQVCQRYPHKYTFLTGFSLGGNFVLRVGIHAVDYKLSLTGIAAISPLINPLSTTKNMQEEHWIYHHYFIKKWKKSLRTKMEYFPEMDDVSMLVKLKSLKEMHDYFVPRHTQSTTTREYFKTYTLTKAQLEQLTTPTHIFSAADDPITTVDELDTFHDLANLSIHTPKYGGHCGFIQDFTFASWIDSQLVNHFNSCLQ